MLTSKGKVLLNAHCNKNMLKLMKIYQVTLKVLDIQGDDSIMSNYIATIHKCRDTLNHLLRYMTINCHNVYLRLQLTECIIKKLKEKNTPSSMLWNHHPSIVWNPNHLGSNEAQDICYSFWHHLQLLKKLSQYLAILQRLMWHKSNKLHNNLKVIYVILCYLSF